MQMQGNLFRRLTLMTAIAALGTASAVADQHGKAEAAAASGPGAGAESAAGMDQERWDALRERTVSASELIEADVTIVANPVGNVRDLVLNSEGTAVEYVLYEAPYPYELYGAENGFVAYDNVAVQPLGISSEIRIDDEADAQASETLEITRAEADRRLVSRVLDQHIAFAGAETRPVEDMLIDRESGKITHIVVNKNPDAWFNDEPRVVAADQVTFDAEGGVAASTEFAALEPVSDVE